MSNSHAPVGTASTHRWLSLGQGGLVKPRPHPVPLALERTGLGHYHLEKGALHFLLYLKFLTPFLGELIIAGTEVSKPVSRLFLYFKYGLGNGKSSDLSLFTSRAATEWQVLKN